MRSAPLMPTTGTRTGIVEHDGLDPETIRVGAFIDGEARGSARLAYVEELDAHRFFLLVHSDEPVTLRLDARGAADVTAGDIQPHPDVEILSRDHPIATLNTKGRLALDITVEQGRGYVSADRNNTSMTIGVIPVDSIYSPVRRVSFDVEATRVDQSTDFDRLVLEIETDGSILPMEALASAGSTLRALVQLIEEMSDEPQGLELGEAAPAASGGPDMELPIEDLELSERPRNCLKRAQVNTVGELREVWPRLSSDEKKLFDVIARAYLAAVMPDFCYRQTTATLDVHGFAFRAAGRQPIDLGWRAAFPDWQPAGENGDDAQLLPVLRDGEVVPADLGGEATTVQVGAAVAGALESV